ncbi:MAG: hypothetical protein ACC628_11960 [Pirellulaceae bacterium]
MLNSRGISSLSSKLPPLRRIFTSKGWELYQQKYEVTIDNSRNKHDFHYIVNGEQTVAKSGTKQQHSSDYPIVVSFDRGDGGDPASKKLENGTYRVGLDIKKRRIELFSSDKEAETVLLTGK